MPFLESLQDGLDRILPKKKVVGISKSVSGIGGTIGVVRYQDDVRLALLLSFYLVLGRVARLVAMHPNLDVLPKRLLRNSSLSPAPCRCLYGPVGHAGLSSLRPPLMGHLACGHFILHPFCWHPY